MQSIQLRIKEIEREIEQIKHSFVMKKMSVSYSKKLILQKERELSRLARRLPEHELEIYLLRKEFGREF